MSEEQANYQTTGETKPLAVIEANAAGALVPKNFEGLWRMATIMSASGMMPKGVQSTEAVFVAIQLGLELGLSPMSAVQNIAVINGRPSIWGDAALAVVEGTGDLEEFEEYFEGNGMQDPNFRAVCKVKRRGRNMVVREFSLADAKRAELLTKPGPWQQYPKRMMQMRARSWALRDTFAHALKGIKIGEEVLDYDMELERAADGSYSAAAPGQSPGPEAVYQDRRDTKKTLAAFIEFKSRTESYDDAALGEFIEKTASANGIAPADVMAEAVKTDEDFVEFIEAFERWNKPKADTETDTTDPKEERPEPDKAGGKYPDNLSPEWKTFRAGWVGMKTGDRAKGTGFASHFDRHFGEWRKAEEEVPELYAEGKAKFEKMYPGETFPPEAEAKQAEEISGGKEPEPAGGSQSDDSEPGGGDTSEEGEKFPEAHQGKAEEGKTDDAGEPKPRPDDPISEHTKMMLIEYRNKHPKHYLKCVRGAQIERLTETAALRMIDAMNQRIEGGQF